MSDNNAYSAGRLIQWALQAKAIPFNELEYRDLLDRYIDDPSFRSMVRQFAEGLGLSVLDANDRGLFLGTQDASVFAQSPSEFRRTRLTGDDRLLDGLIQIAIAATIYPRQQDLDEDSLEAKRPVTVAEVDDTLRSLAAEHRRRAADDSDVASDEADRGLQEAWRVYESRPGVKRTAQGKLSANSTQALIRRHLQLLVDHGCFAVSDKAGMEMYRPTLRYQIQVKELAATKLYLHLQSLLQDASMHHVDSVMTGGDNA